MKLSNKLATAAFVGIVAVGSVAQAQAPQFFRIGTGSAGGTYFPIGGTIANGISSASGLAVPATEGGQCGVPGLIAIAQSTTASVFNNAAVQNGELEAGHGGCRRHTRHVSGSRQVRGQAASEKLRIIANLYPEDLHLVLPKGKTRSGDLGELKGKRVGIAQAGSGTQVAVLQMLEAWGVNRDNMEEAELNNSPVGRAHGRRSARCLLLCGWLAGGGDGPTVLDQGYESAFLLARRTWRRSTRSSRPTSRRRFQAVFMKVSADDTSDPGGKRLLVVSSDQERGSGLRHHQGACGTRQHRTLLDNGHAKGKQITCGNRPGRRGRPSGSAAPGRREVLQRSRPSEIGLPATRHDRPAVAYASGHEVSGRSAGSVQRRTFGKAIRRSGGMLVKTTVHGA